MEVQECCRQILALPFLPVSCGRDVGIRLAGGNNPRTATCHARLDYIWDGQWINNANIPRSLWNCHSRDVRSNNAVEGWNHRFNRRVGVSHPNPWRVIEQLQKEDAHTELMVAQSDAGHRIPIGKALYTRINQRIQALEARRAAGEVETLEFLLNVGRLLHF